MRNLKIDIDFKKLINPLSEEEFKQLETNIKAEGCRDSIVVWKNFIVDGHNRYNICEKNNIDFNVIDKIFKSKEDAYDWIINNQLGRRNITDFQKIYLRGLQYEREKKKATGFSDRVLSGGDNAHRQKTADKLAAIHKVDESTIRRDGVFSKAIDGIAENLGEDIKDKILNRDIKVTKKDIIKIGKLSPEGQLDAIIDGVKEDSTIKKTKGCTKCGKKLPLDDFYADNNQCKSCKLQMQSERKLPRDIHGKAIRIDKEKIKGIDFDALIKDVKNADKEVLDFDEETEIMKFTFDTTRYIDNVNKLNNKSEYLCSISISSKTEFIKSIEELEENIKILKNNIKKGE